ncbi:MAG TPA: TetR/AcrR family transcriptional regulator, partial [Spirochaetota bacterium]|nr:TetR/AcrR family transcriptional regulator [Spirochaetota bacterium]
MGNQIKYDDANVKNQILLHVGEIIFTKGTKGWNMDDLSARVGLAKNTLYRIIGSKEEIIEESVLKHINDVQIKLSSIFQLNEEYIVRLKQAADIFPDLLNAVYSESFACVFNDFPSIEINVINRRKEINKNVIDFIKEGILNKELKNNINAEIVFEAFQAIVIYYLKSDYEP